jgi:hypothetical protein
MTVTNPYMDIYFREGFIKEDFQSNNEENMKKFLTEEIGLTSEEIILLDIENRKELRDLIEKKGRMVYAILDPQFIDILKDEFSKDIPELDEEILEKLNAFKIAIESYRSKTEEVKEIIWKYLSEIIFLYLEKIQMEKQKKQENKGEEIVFKRRQINIE